MKATKIKTFEQACAALDLDAFAIENAFCALPEEKYLEPLRAHAKLVIIAEALNEGWKPNWNDSSESKYYPWFNVKASAKQPSGSGLSYGDFGHWRTNTIVGSRLCFKSSELAEYAGKTFKKLYEAYFLIQ